MRALHARRRRHSPARRADVGIGPYDPADGCIAPQTRAADCRPVRNIVALLRRARIYLVCTRGTHVCVPYTPAGDVIVPHGGPMWASAPTIPPMDASHRRRGRQIADRLPATRYLLPATRYLLPATRYLLPAARCPPNNALSKNSEKTLPFFVEKCYTGCVV